MKKIIYLFCLICTITLAKGQYYRPDRGFLPASMPDILPDRRYGENPEKRYRGKRIGQIPN